MYRSVRTLLSVILFILTLSSTLALPTQAQGIISLQEAIDVARVFYPNAQVIRTELVNTAQPPYYIIGLDNGRSVYINAVNKEVIQITTGQPTLGRTRPQTGASGAVTTSNQAASIALARFPGAQVLYVEFKRKNARWEVKLNNGYEVYISAATGAIIKIEYDDDWYKYRYGDWD